MEEIMFQNVFGDPYVRAIVPFVQATPSLSGINCFTPLGVPVACSPASLAAACGVNQFGQICWSNPVVHTGLPIPFGRVIA